MSELLNSPNGIAALQEALLDIVRMRIRRWFERNMVIGFEDWVNNNKPALTGADPLSILDDLNVAHDQEILDLFDLLKQVEEYQSSYNMDFYVDTVNGDDVNGTGSATDPFATLTRAQQFIPRRIDGNITVTVDAPPANPITDMSSELYEFGYNGQLVIQGVNDHVVESGPFTVAAVGTLGASATMAHTIQAAGPPGWAANSKRGYFVELLTGANAGRYITILSNTTDTIYSPDHSFAPAPGDTFNIISPGTLFAFGDNKVKLTLIDKTPGYVNKSILQLANIKITTNNQLSIYSMDGKILLSLVDVEDISLSGDNTLANYATVKDTSVVIDPALRDTWKSQFFWAGNLSISGRQTICWFCCWDDNYTSALGYANLAYCGFVCLRLFVMANVAIFKCLTGDTAGDNISIYDWYPCNLTIRGLWTLGCTNIVFLENGKCYATDLEGVVGNVTNYGFRIGACATVTFDGVILGGTLNDVQWILTGAAAAYPGIGASITDGNGAYCVRMT